MNLSRTINGIINIYSLYVNYFVVSLDIIYTQKKMPPQKLTGAAFNKLSGWIRLFLGSEN
jgi:hypothetical protein